VTFGQRIAMFAGAVLLATVVLVLVARP